VDILPSLSAILLYAVPVIVAITFHEAAHGYVAWKLGDDTAYQLGRVTFNPLKHIDAFGTVLLPAILIFSGSRFLFGWAKPVPVDFNRLHRPRRDMVIVAAAGPGINLVLAFVSAVLLHVAGLFPDAVAQALVRVLGVSIFFNVLLAVFNMLPLPPLDGGRVAVGLLPDRLARPLARLERFGFVILILVVFVVPIVASRMGYDFNIFSWLILPVTFFVTDVLSVLTGANVSDAIIAVFRSLSG